MTFTTPHDEASSDQMSLAPKSRGSVQAVVGGRLQQAGLLSTMPRLKRTATDGGTSTQHAIDAAAQAAVVTAQLRTAAKSTSGCPDSGRAPRCQQHGPDAHDDARTTLTRGVEDKAADILALRASLHRRQGEQHIGTSTSTLRKTMRKTQTQRASTTSPTSKLRTTRWKSRTCSNSRSKTGARLRSLTNWRPSTTTAS